MRNLFLLILVVLIMPSCNLDTATADVAGTYQRTWEQETFTLTETIVISKDPGTDSRYQVKSRSITRYKDKERKPKDRTKEFTGLYEAENKVLQTPDPGLSFYFDEKLQSFRMGSVTFHKVN